VITIPRNDSHRGWRCCIVSSITEHSFQGIASSPKVGSVTHVSGTMCYLCLRQLNFAPAVLCNVAFIRALRARNLAPYTVRFS
jgi:hypothetical protein